MEPAQAPPTDNGRDVAPAPVLGYDSGMLQLREIKKAFDGEPVLRGISLAIAAGEVVALLGPSGSGKTTLLRIIAGLAQADHGSLLLEGEDLAEIPVHERGFGMVFQDYALFPHKSVGENVAFGLRMLGWPRQRIEERVSQMLALVGLAGFGERRVYELSGGEQQRVALARALAPSPRLLLLDEPLGSLDRALRERLLNELRAILEEVEAVSDRPEGITAVYVTHDQAEAFAVADRVVVMNDGCIEQDASPADLYRHPESPFVARFIGMENLFEAEIISRDPLIVRTDVGTLQVANRSTANLQSLISNRERSQAAILLIRPEAAHIVDPGAAGVNEVHGQVVACSFRGRYRQGTIAVGEEAQLKLEFEVDEPLPGVGEEVWLALAPEALSLLRPEG